VAARIIEVDSGCVTAVNPAKFHFQHIPAGLFRIGRP